MPNHCSIISCMKTSSDSVSVHKAPQDKIGEQWTRFIKHANQEFKWKASKELFLCSDHFKPECRIGSSRHKLIQDSVPCILNGNDVSNNTQEVNRIRPLSLFNNVSLPHQKPIASGSESATPFYICTPHVVVDDHSKCIEDIRQRDLEILYLKRELEDCRHEIRNLNRRLGRSDATKRKLKDEGNDQRCKIRKLENTHSSLKETESDELPVRQLKSLLQDITGRLTNPNIPYSDQIKNFSFNLHYSSPKTYESLRNTFHKTLPHSRNFSRWTSHINSSPGFLPDSLNFIANKVKSTPHQILFSLSFDEIHLRKQMIYRDGKMHGYVNYGGIDVEPDTEREAAAALFFLATEINGSFKIPIGYILTKGLPTSLMANVITQSLQKMFQVGAKVLSITFDGLKSNLAAVEKLGAKLDPRGGDARPFILHPDSNEKVFLILDPSHMMKLIRNHFKTANFMDNQGRVIKWSYIEALHTLQLQSGLRAANKITSRHVNFQNQKMKTRLCTQILSNSIGVSLEFCRKIGIKEFDGSEGTEMFLKTMDRLFDATNSKSSGKSFKAPLSKSNEDVWETFFDFCVAYLLELKVEVDGEFVEILETDKSTGVKGLITTILSLQMIMRECSDILYFPVYKMGQDMLETFFSLIRSRFGFNNNPNVLQLEAALRAILCCRLDLVTSCGNCVDQEETSTKISCFQNLTSMLNEEDVPELSKFVKCIVTYISGFVSRSLLSKLHCVDCLICLYSSEEDHIEDCELIDVKDNGGLVKPVSTVVSVCNVAEQKLRKCEEMGMHNFKDSILIDEVLKECSRSGILAPLRCRVSGKEHDEDMLVKRVLCEYTKVRLHHIAKESTLKINPTTNRSVCNKVVHFRGL